MSVQLCGSLTMATARSRNIAVYSGWKLNCYVEDNGTECVDTSVEIVVLFMLQYTVTADHMSVYLLLLIIVSILVTADHMSV